VTPPVAKGICMFHRPGRRTEVWSSSPESSHSRMQREPRQVFQAARPNARLFSPALDRKNGFFTFGFPPVPTHVSTRPPLLRPHNRCESLPAALGLEKFLCGVLRVKTLASSNIPEWPNV